MDYSINNYLDQFGYPVPHYLLPLQRSTLRLFANTLGIEKFRESWPDERNGRERQFCASWPKERLLVER